MRHIFRCLTAAILAFSITACSIGEGNGIVSIRIVALDGSTDFKIRADQCEGFLIGVIATFTDGQELFYSSRSEFSLANDSDPGKIIPLTNNAGFTTAAELVPTSGASPGDKITVKATYLSLEATQEFTVSNVEIDGFSIEPAQVTLISGESQNISPVITLSDGTRLTGIARAITYTLTDNNASPAFELGGLDSLTGGEILNSLEERSGSATITARFCDDQDGDDENDRSDINPPNPVTISSSSYFGDDPAIKLELRTNFDGNGRVAPTPNNPVKLPSGIRTTVSAHLVFPNNAERNVTLTSQLSASNSDGDCNDATITCDVNTDGLNGTIETSSTTPTNKLTFVAATHTTSDGNSLNTDPDNPLSIDVIPTAYNTPAFILRDEANHALDLSANSEFRVTTGAAPLLFNLFARMLDETEDPAEPYELAVGAQFTSPDPDSIVTAGTALIGVGAAETTEPLTIDLEINVAPGTEDDYADKQPIESISASLDRNAPGELIIDVSNDPTRNPEHDDSLTLTEGDSQQLRAFREYSGAYVLLTDKLLATPEGTRFIAQAPTWTSSNPEVASVSNVTNNGLITAISAGTATITAKHQFRTFANDNISEDELATESRQISITVNAP